MTFSCFALLNGISHIGTAFAELQAEIVIKQQHASLCVHGLTGGQPVVVSLQMATQCVVTGPAPCPRRASSPARLFLLLPDRPATAAGAIAPTLWSGYTLAAPETNPGIQRTTSLTRPLHRLTQLGPHQAFNPVYFVHITSAISTATVSGGNCSVMKPHGCRYRPDEPLQCHLHATATHYQ